jgi:hypothetical protein
MCRKEDEVRRCLLELTAEIVEMQGPSVGGGAVGRNEETKPLNDFADSTYSQSGEDGIIAEILHRLESSVSLDHWCAEFGAWDGVHLSNTCKLIRERSYSAVLIEGDPDRVKDLHKNFPEENVFKVCKFVQFEGPGSLERIFSTTPIPFNFDVLSIDVDGVDYHIFESLVAYRPKVVCIEFNPTIPNAVDFVQAKDFTVKHGSSGRALTRLARSKDYALVASTLCNLIFIDIAYLRAVTAHEACLEDVNEQGNDPQYIFSGYDGTILSNKQDVNLLWHSLAVPISKVQFLPGSLRKHAADYGALKQLGLILFLIFHLPHTGIRRLGDRVRARISRLSLK